MSTLTIEKLKKARKIMNECAVETKGRVFFFEGYYYPMPVIDIKMVKEFKKGG